MSKPGAGTYAALLRGVNVGGKNKLPMKDLCAMFSSLGCADVVSYIQSGNVVFRADKRLLRTIAGSIQEGIAGRFGFQSPVILRSHEELAEVVRGNPYAERTGDEKALYVMFLADHPAGEQTKSLDPDRSAPDEYIVRGRDIYMYLIKGAATTRLTNAYFDSRLKTVSTSRNWRTVLTLCEMTRPK
jgi:uncharacterized protein (DUF1697 family)